MLFKAIAGALRSEGIGFLRWAAVGMLSLTSFSVQGALKFYNLPEGFRDKLEQRAQIDQYQLEHYQTESNLGAEPYSPAPKRKQERKGTIRVLHSSPEKRVLDEWTALPESFVPPRGYRAPLFGRTNEDWPAFPTKEQTNAVLKAKATWVEEHLAFDGLLKTVATLIFKFDEGGANTRFALAQAGIPIDWLDYFRSPTENGPGTSTGSVLEWILAEKRAGQTLEAVCGKLNRARMEFRPSLEGHRVAVEDGAMPLQLLRIQIGGGYQGGIVPGSSLDFAGNLLDALPESKVLLSVQEEFFGPCHMLAALCWPLRRAGQLTMIGEPLPVSAWAQDNGKAGFVKGGAGQSGRAAALAPRFASRDDGESRFLPGDSLLMQGVREAGLEVAQSPLLFQGGDLMAVEDPKTGRRVLLVGEGEVYRNTALGLAREQVLEAFRVEMGVDECLVWPEGSFHLDYDVTFRRRGEQLLAFVNEPVAAAKIMVDKGVSALAQAHFVTVEKEKAIRAGMQSGGYEALHELLQDLQKRGQTAQGAYKTDLVRSFKESAVDSATVNFQCFITAADFLLATAPGFQAFAETKERGEYLRSLRELGESLRKQRELLSARGWRIVPVPSMPDLSRSVNYLNGLQDKGRYVMPAWGGFYRELDAAATTAFREAMGEEIRIVPIQCAQSQSQHGSIHCMVKAYPAGE